jgi:hypothetical protein
VRPEHAGHWQGATGISRAEPQTTKARVGIAQIMVLGTHIARVIRHKEYETDRRPRGPRARVALPLVERSVLPLPDGSFLGSHRWPTPFPTYKMEGLVLRLGAKFFQIYHLFSNNMIYGLVVGGTNIFCGLA